MGSADNVKKHEDFLKRVMLEFQKMYPEARIWKNNTGALESKKGHYVRYGKVGSSDLIGVMPPNGRMTCIEIKTGKAKQSKKQKDFEQMISKCGGIYIVVRDDAQIEPQLLKLKREPNDSL